MHSTIQSALSPSDKMFAGVLSILFLALLNSSSANLPVVVAAWEFNNATAKAFEVLNSTGDIFDAIEQGCSVCEVEQCDRTVGYGGSPDEDGETTLDAMIMDGQTFNVGAVASMRRIKSAISVARKVMDHTSHSILAGDLATQFAVEMGFKEESLSTSESKQMWTDWRNNQCQPNFWVNVSPDPNSQCGPYTPIHANEISVKSKPHFSRGGEGNHDTIGMVAIDTKGHLAAGTSTNGLKHKIPGRVGDSPIPGAGAYVDNTAGGAACTGDGDVMLRFLPSYQAVESMRQGHPPAEAARIALSRITTHYPEFEGGLVALSKDGIVGAACHGLKSGSFPFTVATPDFNDVITMSVDCIR